jgi:hypothetical protein
LWQRPWEWLYMFLGKKVWAVHGCLNRKVQTHHDQKKMRQAKSKVKTCSSFFISRGCSQRIHPGRPNSQFPTLLWHFTVSVKLCQAWPQTLATKELAVASPQFTDSHPLFTRKSYTRNNMTIEKCRLLQCYAIWLL